MGIALDRMRSSIRRALPASLQGRLAVTVLVVNLTVVAVVAVGNWTFGTTRIERLTEADGIRHLTALGDYLDTHAEELGDQLESALLLTETTRSAPGPVLERVRMTYGRPVRPSALAWVPRDGSLPVSLGDAADCAAIVALGRDRPVALSGVVALPSGPALVAAEPAALGAAASPGLIVVARPIDAAVLDGFHRPTGPLLTLTSPAADRSEGRQHADVGRFTDVHIVRALAPFRLTAQLHDASGLPAASIELTEAPDEIASLLRLLRDQTGGLAVLLAVVGLGIAVFISRAISGEIDRLAMRVRRHASPIVEGGPYRPGGLDDDALTRELAELGDVFDELLLRLAERQTSLALAVRNAKETEASFRSAINDSVEAKLLIVDGLIRIANPAATACLGVPAASLIDRSLEDALRDSGMRADDDGRRLDWETLVAFAVEEPIVVRYSHAGQSERWLEFTASTRFAEPHYQTLLTARDITELRRVEELRGEIVSIVSHDLRAPLTVVTGYLDLMGSPVSEEVREKAVAEARRQAERMAGLLEDLLSATRAEELFTPKALLPVSIADLAEDVALSLGPTAPSYRFIARAECRGTVLGEEKRLRQAVVNLVTNAVKYSPADSEVRLIVDTEGQRVRLAVEDEGPGIPQADRRRVFDRFTRLKAAGSSKTGFGLGLYIVRLIAESHGGTVHVEQASGGGARFVLQLPTVAAMPEPEPVEDMPEELSDAG